MSQTYHRNEMLRRENWLLGSVGNPCMSSRLFCKFKIIPKYALQKTSKSLSFYFNWCLQIGVIQLNQLCFYLFCFLKTVREAAEVARMPSQTGPAVVVCSYPHMPLISFTQVILVIFITWFNYFWNHKHNCKALLFLREKIDWMIWKNLIKANG